MVGLCRFLPWYWVDAVSPHDDLDSSTGMGDAQRSGRSGGAGSDGGFFAHGSDVGYENGGALEPNLE